jgi:hypothetical protein
MPSPQALGHRVNAGGDRAQECIAALPRNRLSRILERSSISLNTNIVFDLDGPDRPGRHGSPGDPELRKIPQCVLGGTLSYISNCI